MPLSKSQILRQKFRRLGYSVESTQNDIRFIKRGAKVFGIFVKIYKTFILAAIPFTIVFGIKLMLKTGIFSFISFTIFVPLFLLFHFYTISKKRKVSHSVIIRKNEIELNLYHKIMINKSSIQGFFYEFRDIYTDNSNLDFTIGYIVIKEFNETETAIMEATHEESRILKSEMKYILEVLAGFMGVSVLDERNKT